MMDGNKQEMKFNCSRPREKGGRRKFCLLRATAKAKLCKER